jgi:hypothetical protein
MVGERSVDGSYKDGSCTEMGRSERVGSVGDGVSSDRVRTLGENAVGVLVPGERAVGVRPGEGMVTGLSDGVRSEGVCIVGENVDVSWSIEFMDGERKVEGRCDGGGVSS